MIAPSAALAARGVRTSGDYVRLMDQIGKDVLNHTLPHEVANAATRAYGLMLKAVHLQHRYGQPGADGSAPKTLRLHS